MCLKKTLDIVENLQEKTKNITALEWYDISTCAVDTVHSYAKETLQKAKIN